MFNKSTSNIQTIKNENNKIVTQNNIDVVHGNVFHIEHHYTHEQHLESIDTVDSFKFEFQISVPILSFHGRDYELQKIKQLFFMSTSKETYKMVAICGFPGIGKSECAKQYIFKNRTHYNNLIWINAETNNNIENSFQNLAKKLMLSSSDCQDIYKKLCGSTLFVFDNIESMKILKKFLPNSSNNFNFLLTSLNKDWGEIQSIELNKLTSKDAVEVLQSILGNHCGNIQKGKLEKLAESLNCIPLTLQIGAHYILQQIKNDELLQENRNIELYIDAVESKRNVILNEEFPDSSDNQYSNSAYKTICLNLEKIIKEDNQQTQLAYDILSVISYLNPDCLKQSHLLELSEFKKNELFLKEAIVILIKYCFIRIENYTYLFYKYKKIIIHRLIQECLRYHHNQCKNDEYYKIALQFLLKEEMDHYTTIHYESILKHAEDRIETFLKFFITNKSNRLNKILIQYASQKLLTKLFDKLGSNIDPSLLCSSVIMDEMNITNLLLERGIDANYKNYEGRIPLHYARSEECISLLISKGKSMINIKDNDGETPVSHAFRHRPWKIVKCLIQNGADVNLLYEENKTLLHLLPSMTTFSNIDLSKEKASFLIHYGAKCDVKDLYGRTPIDQAMINKWKFLADLMISLTNSEHYNNL